MTAPADERPEDRLADTIQRLLLRFGEYEYLGSVSVSLNPRQWHQVLSALRHTATSSATVPGVTREETARVLMDRALWSGAFDRKRGPANWLGADAEREHWLSMADAVLALLTPAPAVTQPEPEAAPNREEVHLTTGQQKSMHEALRRSRRVVSDPPPSPVGATVPYCFRVISPRGGYECDECELTWDNIDASPCPRRTMTDLGTSGAVQSGRINDFPLVLAPQDSVEQMRREIQGAGQIVDGYHAAMKMHEARAEAAEARLAEATRLLERLSVLIDNDTADDVDNDGVAYQSWSLAQAREDAAAFLAGVGPRVEPVNDSAAALPNRPSLESEPLAGPHVKTEEASRG